MKSKATFQYDGQQLYAEKVAIKKILNSQETPFYLYSESEIRNRYQQLKSCFKEKINICYAVKANSNLAVLNILKQEGSGFDLVSGGELFRVGSIQADPNKIVFSGVGKRAEEISSALNYQGHGIKSFQVESAEELKLLNQIAKKENKFAPVCLRFNPDVNPKTHPHISTGLKENKFGLFRNQVIQIANESTRKYKSIKFLGLSLHIGSQITDLKVFETAFKKTDQLLFSLKKKMPHLEMIDVGGGVGISYQKEKTINWKNYAFLIETIFGKNSHWNNQLKIFLEPGRMIVGPTGILVTRILFRKKNQKRNFLIVDAGMNDLLRPSLYGGYHKILSPNKTGGSKIKFDVVGPICESADTFIKQVPLSSDLKSGDLLAFQNVGAYGFAMANQYNSHPRCAEILVHGSEWRVVRTQEKESDLTRGEVV